MITLAKWIGSPEPSNNRVLSFEKCFYVKADKKIKTATLYVSAMGVYVPYLNGERITDNVLMPGWTTYRKRVQYQTYDVREFLTDNENRVSIGLGNGWACGRFGFFFKDCEKIMMPSAVIAYLSVVYDDGECAALISDESWQVYTTEVTFADIYDGETIDKTAERAFLGNAVEKTVKTRIIKQVGEDIVENERLKPLSLIITKKGERVIDFGQNMTGYVELKIKAARGATVVIEHAEVLDADGNFYTANYRGAKNRLTFVCDGEENLFKPSYTFQGFRYVRLAEYPFDEIDLDAFTAIVVHSNIKKTAEYKTANPLINQLYHNIVWGQKSNYLDVPTDCPQRDERLGWTGDTQVFCRTAAINYDVEKFFIKWLSDVSAEQRELKGGVCSVVPSPFKKVGKISAAWGDAAAIVPWELYLAYGNKALLKKHFPIMKRWVDHLHAAGPCEFLWLGGDHYGDWLAMDAGEDSFLGATSKDLIASAYFAYSTSLLIKAGKILGKDMAEYEKLHKNIVRAFREYFMENGIPKESTPNTFENEKKRPSSGITQTAITLILHFGLAKEEEKEALVALLLKLIRENDGLMSTGFVGTPYLLHVLSDYGYTDVAYDLLLEERVPSWLYSVTHGATTMWEHWNGIKEDGSFWSEDMNSFNHYAYGAVFDWMFGVSSGIKPTENGAGYKEITLTPHPDKRLGYADTKIDSRSGIIRSYWRYEGEKIVYEFEIPEGCVAHLSLPGGRCETLGGGCYRFEE